MTDLIKLPLISFVVTSFNYEKYIVKTLESIKNQTYENIEIVVVDDKSSDNSVEKIKEFISQNEALQISLIEHSENLGQMAAIQSGLEKIKGTFVCFIDSDDILIPDYAKTLIRVHLSTSVAVASSQLIEIGENDEVHTTYSVSSFHKEIKRDISSLQDLFKIDVDNVDYKILSLKEASFGGWYWSAMSANMFRVSALKMILSYENVQGWRICPDKFLLNFAHLIGGSALVYAPLVGYRRHSSNAGCSSQVCGCKRYNNDKISKINIENNKKIRFDMLKFIFSKKADFEKEFGKRNVRGFIFNILISFFRIDFKKVTSMLVKH